MPALAGEKIITVALDSEAGEGPSNSVMPHMELRFAVSCSQVRHAQSTPRVFATPEETYAHSACG